MIIFDVIYLFVNNPILRVMGQSCLSNNTVEYGQESTSRIESGDVVKAKLKHARDRINIFISRKQLDVGALDKKIAQKLPHYQQTGNKRELVPLLKAKKSLRDYIQSAQIRLKLINQKLMQVQMQKINADTVNVLDDANKYIKYIEDRLQQKDWRSILQESEHKYHLDWPQDDSNIQEDPAFQQMWRQIGGNKIQRQINVRPQIPANNNHNMRKNPPISHSRKQFA